MKRLLAALVLFGLPAWAQSPVYEAPDDEASVDMATALLPGYFTGMVAQYRFDDPDNLGWDSAYTNRAESATFSSGDFVSVPDQAAFDHSNGKGLAACLWMDDVGNDEVLLYKGGFTNSELYIHTETNVVTVYFSEGLVGDTSTSVSAAFTPDAKTFVCGYFYDPLKKARISINGAAYTSDADDMDYDVSNTSEPLLIGSNLVGPDLAGIIDQLIFFIDGEPPASDLYNSGAGRDCQWVEENTTATACWSMDLSSWGIRDSISGAAGTITGELEATAPLVSYGDAFDLTPVNTPTAKGGARGYAAHFIRGSSYATASDTASLSGSSDDMLFCSWSVPTLLNASMYMMAKADVAPEWRMYFDSSERLAVYAYDTVGSSTHILSAPLFTDSTTRIFACGAVDTSAGAAGVSVDGASFSWDLSPLGSMSVRDTSESFGVAAAPDGSSGFTGDLGPSLLIRGTDLPFDTLVAALSNSGKGMTCEQAEAAGLRGSNGVSCWNMTENGGPYVDSWGSNDLTGVSTPTQAAGLVELPDSGMGVYFSADGSYLTVAADGVRGSATSGFWRSVWGIQDTASSTDYFWSQLWGNTGDAGRLTTTTASCTFYDGAVSILATVAFSTFPQDEWVFMNCYWDPATGYGYIAYYDADEQLSAQTASSFVYVPQTAGHNLNISHTSTSTFRGVLDHFTQWNRPPVPGEIDALWNLGVGFFQ